MAHHGDALLVVAVLHDVRVPDAGHELRVGDALHEVALVAGGRHAPVVAGQDPRLGPLDQPIGPACGAEPRPELRLGSELGFGTGSGSGRRGSSAGCL